VVANTLGPGAFSSKLAKLGTILAAAPAAACRLGLSRMGYRPSPQLYYVVSDANWITDWIGSYVTKSISEQYGWRTHVTTAPHVLVGHILHYSELGAFLATLGTRRNTLNTVVATVFHGSQSDEFPGLKRNVERLIANADVLARVVTANTTMEGRLIEWGFPSDKVIRIPLGIDLARFEPATDEQRKQQRRKLGIAEDVVCVGSLQKDGVGWKDGLEPKLVKGPDVLLRVIERLKDHYKVHVLLTAPARGYVKRGLESLGVPYSHLVVSDYRDIAEVYHCLDVCLVASREEGGPMAVLESLASGVPLVSTRMGLAADIIEHGDNGLLADSEDSDALAQNVADLIEKPDLRDKIIVGGRSSVVAYDWEAIASRYYRELYRPLLDELLAARSESEE